MLSPLSRAFVWVSLLVGTTSRAIPLFDLNGRALRQFPSEDGYLMLTIARNLAMGNGLSVEAGTTLTNGTQPLMTGIYAGLFWLIGGDKVWGVFLVQVVGLVIGLVSAFLVYRVGSILLSSRTNGATVAAVAAAAWYLAPLGARYGQNCLETGAATLVPLTIGMFFLRYELDPGRHWPLRRCVELGMLLGLAFWVRNDAVLLSAAVCSTLVLSALGSDTIAIGRRLLEACCIGFTALFIVSPWLWFNYSEFGHIVPVSGISQGAETLGENLAHLPSILVEQVSVVALIPLHWEARPIVLVAASVALVVWIALVYRETRQLSSASRYWVTVISVWAGFLIVFYGFVYGAGYFMGRYLFPLSPWVAILSVWLAHRLWARLGGARPELALGLALSVVVILSIGLDVRAFRHGTNNGHFQIVEWVEEHVADDVWVAAVQTGTLGFFHDRTYNLDGKVSPPALEARFEGRIFEYVLGRPIAYLVDWVGIADWADDPRLSQHFEVVLVDEQKDIAVLRRLGPAEPSAN